MRKLQTRVSIESLCLKVTSGGTPSRSNSRYWDGGTIPWVKTGELHDGYIEDAEEYITELAVEESSAKIFPSDTVLMAMYGDGRTITSLGILRNPAATNQACCAMLADPLKCDFRYLFYALRHHRRELLGRVVAGAQRNLSGGIIRKFPITWWPLKEQEKIAETLIKFDELIGNNSRRVELLEKSTLLAFEEWFIRLRYPGHKQKKVINGIPEGWERVPLENAFVLQRGFDLPIQSRKSGSVPIYSSTGICGYHNEARASAPGVVTGRSGTLGEVHFVRESFWPLNTALWVKEFRRLPPLYALFVLRSLDLEKYNGGVSVPTLDRKSVHRIKILIPPKSLIDEFIGFAETSFSQIGNLRRQNEKLGKGRDLLLPRLMDGRIAL